MTTVQAVDSLPAHRHSAELRKAVIAATIGTTIEWYDFFIYGTAAGLIFGKLYFPNEAPLTATLAAFGTSSSALSGARSALRYSATMATASAARRH